MTVAAFGCFRMLVACATGCPGSQRGGQLNMCYNAVDRHVEAGGQLGSRVSWI